MVILKARAFQHVNAFKFFSIKWSKDLILLLIIPTEVYLIQLLCTVSLALIESLYVIGLNGCVWEYKFLCGVLENICEKDDWNGSLPAWKT